MPAAQYWLGAPLIAVGAVAVTVGVAVPTFAEALAADGELWLPTRSETVTR